jgi:hypothetical protein
LDKHVETIIISSKGDGQLSRLRLSNSIITDCLRNSNQDILVWMDEHTRNVSKNPYIIYTPGAVPAPVPLATWDLNSKEIPKSLLDSTGAAKVSAKVSANSGENKSKDSANGGENKSKEIPPPPPSYPRPQETLKPNESAAPLAPVQESYTTPVSDLSTKQRRKHSLKYYMYD